MSSTQKSPIAFISFSAGERVSTELADVAHRVLTSLKMDTLRYRDARGAASMANVDEHFAESSLSHVDEADLVVAIVIPYHYGYRPAPKTCDGADGTKSLGWLEMERAWHNGKTVITMLPQTDWDSSRYLPPELVDAVNAGLKKLLNAPEEDQEALGKFLGAIEERGDATNFASVDVFAEQLKRAVERWQKGRLLGVSLYKQPTADFTGQKALRRELADRLRVAGVYGISGGPGIGKSELIARVAADFAEQQTFRRILSIDCHARTSEELAGRLLREVGSSLDIQGHTKAQVEEGLGRSANLVILDQVVTSRMLDLIPGGESTTVVVTNNSRVLANLGVPKSNRFRVGRLEDEAGMELLRHKVGSERAEAEPEALKRLAASLAGWPLGLQLAGAIIHEDEVSPEPVAALLAKFREKGLEALDSPDEQSRFEMYTAALPAAVRTSLAGIVALPATFTREAAAIATAVESDSLVAHLNSLLGLGLIASDSDGRMWLQPEARLFVGRDAAMGELTESSQQRIDAHYLGFIERIARGDRTVFDDPAWDDDAALDIVWRNRDELTRRRDLFLGTREVAVRIGAWKRELALVDYVRKQSDDAHTDGILLLRSAQLQLHGRRWKNAETELRQAIAILRGEGGWVHVARALTSLARALAHQRKNDAAIEALEEALKLERKLLPSGRGIAFVLHSMGRVYLSQKRYDRATECLSESATIGRRLRDARHLSLVYSTLAQLYQTNGRPEEALKALEAAREAAERDRNPRQCGLTLLFEGDVYRDLGRLDDAVQSYRRSADIADRLADRFFRWSVQYRLGQTLNQLGREDEGREALEASLSDAGDLRSSVQSFWGLIESYRDDDSSDLVDLLARLFELHEQFSGGVQSAILYNVIAGLLRDRGEIEQAVQANRRALEISRATESSRGISITVHELAKTLVAGRRRSEATDLLEERLAELDLLSTDRSRILTTLGSHYSYARDYSRAIEHLEHAVALEESLGHEKTAQKAFPLLSLGNVLRRAGRPRDALPHLEDAALLEKDYGTPHGLAKVYHSIAQTRLQLRDYVEAETAARLSETAAVDGELDLQFVMAQRLLGLIHKRRGELSKAEDRMRRGLDRARAAGIDGHVPLALADLGDLLACDGKNGEAQDVLREGLAISRSAPLSTRIFLARRLGRVLIEDAKVEAGLEAYGEGSALADRGDLPSAEPEYRLLIKEYVSALRDYDRDTDAEQVLRSVLARAERSAVWSLHLFAVQQIAGLKRDRREAGGTEIDDLYRNAISLYSAHGQLQCIQWALADLSSHVSRRNGPKRAAEMLQSFLAQGVLDSAPPAVRFGPVHRRAELLRHAGRADDSMEAADQALALAIEADRADLMAQARIVQAGVHLDSDREERALEILTREYDRFVEGEVDSATAMALAKLFKRVDPVKAEEMWLGSWKEALESRNVVPLVTSAREICRIRLKQKRASDAERTLKETERIVAEKGSVGLQASVWHELGVVYHAMRRSRLARTAFEKSVELRREAGDVRWLVQSIGRLVAELRKDQEFDTAFQLVREVQTHLEEIRPPRQRSMARTQVAAVLKDMGMLGEAEDVARQACEEAFDDPQQRGAARLTLASILRRLERSAEARAELREAREELQNYRESTSYGYVLTALADNLHRARRGPEAGAMLEERIELDAELDRPFIENVSLRARLANAQRISGRLVDAFGTARTALTDLERALNTGDLRPGSRDVGRTRISLETTFANIAIDMNRVDDSRNVYARRVAEASDPDYWSLQGLAKVESLAGNAEDSQTLFERAARVMHDNIRSRVVHWQDRGFALLRLQRFDDALAALDTCVEEIAPVAERPEGLLTRSFVLAKRALVLVGLGRLDEATSDAEQGRELAMRIQSLEAKVVTAISGAKVQLHAGEFEKALSTSDSALDFMQSGQEGPFRRITLLYLAAEALQGLGRREEAEERVHTADGLRKVAAEGGVVFTAYELGKSLPVPVAATTTESTPIPGFHELSTAVGAGHRIRQGHRVEGVVREVQDDGVAVELREGATGFCPARELFLGIDGDVRPHVRVGERFSFMTRLPGVSGREGVALSRTALLRTLLNDVQGNVASVRVSGPIEDGMARVELADRTWMQMDLWRHVGWGKRAFFDSLADPDTRLRIRFLGFESGMLTGSAKELYAEAIAQSTGALRGTIVESFHGGAFISLAPGVVGICSAANLVPGRPMLLAVGSPVAVRVDAVDERRIELNRNRALASVLTDAAGKTVRGFVDRVEPSYAIVEIAPGIAGLLHVSEFAGKGRSLVGQLRRDEEVAVRVLSVSREGERFNIKLSGNQLSSDVGQIEAGGDLVELLPNPDVDLSEVLAAALAGEGRSRIKSRSRKTHDPGVQRHQ